jgi:predicted aspartyl protease
LRLSFDPKQGLIVVPVRISGPAGDLVINLILDTGATMTMVSREAVLMVGCDPDASAGRVEFVTGSRLEHAPRLRILKVEAMGISRIGMYVVCHTMPAGTAVDGVLGLDFFRGCILKIDLDAGCVEV